MTTINTLQASSALSIVAASASATSGSQNTLKQQGATTWQIQISTTTSSAVGHAALVSALSVQDQYADVKKQAIAYGVDPKNIPSDALEMLQEHLSDTPNLVMAFQSTSQFNAELSQNRMQSSADISAALYSGRGVDMLGAQPFQFSDLMDDLKMQAKSAGSAGNKTAQSQIDAAVSGMERAFADGTLTIQSAYEIPGVATPGTGWHFTGPANDMPTGFDPGSGATISWPSDTPDASGQNHYITGTSAGTLIYFSWAASKDESAPKASS